MVARGDEQRANVEFGELFASTVDGSSDSVLTAMACELGLCLRNFDTDLTFVQSDLEEIVFMRLPQGCGMLSRKIVRLKRVYVD